MPCDYPVPTMKKRASRVNWTHAAGHYYRDESVLRSSFAADCATWTSRWCVQQIVKTAWVVLSAFNIESTEEKSTKVQRRHDRTSAWRLTRKIDAHPLSASTTWRWLAGWMTKKSEIRWTGYQGRAVYIHSFTLNSLFVKKNNERWSDWRLE